MAVRKVKYQDKEIFIEDEVSEDEKGYISEEYEKDLDETQKIELDDDSLSGTLTNIFGDKNE